MPKNKESQMQRVVRKQRSGVYPGGTVTIHVNGYSVDLFWRTRKEFYKAIDTMSECRKDLWEINKQLMKLKNGVPDAKE